MLLFIYLCEYFHLVIASVQFILFFAGGWFSLKIWSLLPSMYLPFSGNSYYLI
jgi:hypothetical protein